MVAIPQSGLLAHVSSLRLPSGPSGWVLTLSNAARASLPSPHLRVADADLWAASPLGELPLGMESMGFNCLFFLPVMLPSVVPRFATDSAVRVFPGIWTLLSFLRLSSQDGAPSLPLLPLYLYLLSLYLYLLYFFLPPFEDNGLLFWVPDVLCRHSEVVLWNVLSFQMFF